MGLTRRKDSYYVEFPVLDDGKVLSLAPGAGGRLQRWKVARSPRFRLLMDNPASHVRKPDPCNERNRIASKEEYARLYQTAAPHFRPILTIAHSLGTRRGELLQLEWPDVDLRRREFTLRHTKNGEDRVIPMTPDVYEAFTELAKLRRLDTQRVFLYKGRPLRNLRTAFAAACRRAGIVGLRFHDLRHTAATNLRRAGVDTMTAMKIVGHKSEQMHRRYSTVTPADLHQAAAKLNTYLTLANSTVNGQNASACKTGVGA